MQSHRKWNTWSLYWLAVVLLRLKCVFYLKEVCTTAATIIFLFGLWNLWSEKMRIRAQDDQRSCFLSATLQNPKHSATICALNYNMTKTFLSFHTAATHAKETGTVPNCINEPFNVRMSYLQWQKWSMDSLFFHNMHCQLWYVLGHKCLALLPWQPKAALHTIRPLTVFFFFLFQCCTGTFFF